MNVPTLRWTDREHRYRSDVHRVPKRRRKAPVRSPDTRLVFAKEQTEAIKLGPVSATYAAQASCPDACPFRGAGCYAEHGPLAMVTTKRLNRAASGRTALDVAREEAAAIDGLSATRDLRLHVVGDCPSDEAAHIVADAAERYVARGRGRGCAVRVWTYTHAWRTVARASWGCVSVLASCETHDDVRAARARGYAAALVVSDHTSRARDAAGVLACPEQTTRGVTCSTCRLCTDDTRLLAAGIVIGFALHGDRAGLAKARRTLAEAQP